MVFLGFLLFPFFVQDDRKASKNDPRKPPRLPQTPPKSSQNILKWHRRARKWLQDAFWHSRTHPRHAPDAPKTRQDCPRHVRTTQKSLQDLSKIRFLRVWGLKNKYFEWYSWALIHPSLYASKPLVSCRPRRDSRSVYNFTRKLILMLKIADSLQNPGNMTKTDFRNQKKSIFSRIGFSMFWWSPNVVGGWNFDCA